MLINNKYFKEFVGNKNTTDELLGLINKSKATGAYMLKGPEGLGKAYLAKILANNLLNIKGKMSENNIHPDLFLIDNKLDNKKQISVEKVRGILSFLSKTSLSSLGKIVIIDAIDNINTFGHNSLLKVLEELKSANIIFIINHSSSFIPATIQSRCKVLKFRPLTEIEVKNVLASKYSKLSEEDIDFYVNASNGSIGYAIKQISYDMIHKHNEVLKILKDIKIKKDKVLYIADLFNDAKTKDKNFNSFSELFISLLSKCLKIKSDINVTYLSLSEQNFLKDLGGFLTYNDIFYLIDNLKSLQNNLNIYNMSPTNSIISFLSNFKFIIDNKI